MRTTYDSAGVNTDQEERGLQLLIERVQRTWPASGIGTVQLPIGYFANVIDLGGIGLAITADGVGSKVLIAQMMEKYDTVGIDCVAMNVNDLLCVGARPVSMVDYIAIQRADPEVLADLAEGLRRGAELANVSIPGGEIAQLPDIVIGHGSGIGFDLAGMAVGTVALDRILIGKDLREGDVIVGVESSGIHSNGMTLARQALFQKGHLTVETKLPALDCSLGEELLKPTHIYVREAMEILDQGIAVKAFAHITSDGFLNLSRVAAEVGFVIEQMPAIPPVFPVIQEYGGIDDAEMFRVYNMGIGFCIVVSARDADQVIACVRRHGKQASVLGHVVSDPRRRVHVKPAGLVGEGKYFARA